MAQGQKALAQTLIQMERVFATAPTAGPKTKKVYFENNTLGRSQSSETSKDKRGSSRHPTRGIAGTIDVAGSINQQLNAVSAMLYAALGSVSITGSSVTVGSAFSAPTISAYDWVNQQITIAETSHGVSVGGTVEVIATAPTIMNGTFYYPVIDVPDSGHLVIRVPMGGSGTITLTSIKPCTGGTFTYTYKAGGALPSYHIEKGFPDITDYFLYKGCKCGGLNVDGIGASGPVTISTDWMGASETTATSSYETGTAIDNTKIAFDNSMLAAADVKEGGSAVTFIKSLSFKLDNALDGDTFVAGGAGVRGGINPGVYQVTGSMQAVFENLTLYNKALNRTESSLDVTFKQGTGAGTAGNESIQIVAPELLFTAKSPPVDGDGGAYLDCDFVGDYTDNADATAFKVIVKCTQLPGQVI